MGKSQTEQPGNEISPSTNNFPGHRMICKLNGNEEFSSHRPPKPHRSLGALGEIEEPGEKAKENPNGILSDVCVAVLYIAMRVSSTKESDR